MASPISFTTPGKRVSEFQERSVRQKQESTELSYLERLPFELKRMVAEHLQSRDDLKNLAEVSADWKDAALEVINLQNMHAAVEELKDLSDFEPDAPKRILSALDVYKAFLLDENDDDDFLDLIDPMKLPQLLETLTAVSTQQVAERFKALKLKCYNDIGSQKASLDSLDQNYSDLKCEFVVQAFEHIISAANNPGYIRGLAFGCAAKSGLLEIVRSLFADGAQVSQGFLKDAFELAAANGHLEIVQFLLVDKAKISKYSKCRAFILAAAKGHLAVVQFLLADGNQISKEIRCEAVRKAADKGHNEIVSFLLSDGAQIS
jgi:hypothetical protein